MANFNTHFAVGTFATGMAASLCYFNGWTDLNVTLGLWAAGTIGSMLPDIDHDNRAVQNGFFSALAFIVMALTMHWLTANRWGPIESWLFLGLVFFVIRFPIMLVFRHFTQHRGVVHSLLGALTFGVMATVLSHWTLNLTEATAWLMGSFTMLGFVIHLVLDELFAVNLVNEKMKRTFGTALKLVSIQHIGRTAVMFLALVVSFWFTPSMNIPWGDMRNFAVNTFYGIEDGTIKAEVENKLEPMKDLVETAKVKAEEGKAWVDRNKGLLRPPAVAAKEE